MSDNIICNNGCCVLKTSLYDTSVPVNDEDKYGKRKAGILLYDKTKECVLLVQSRGNLWGIPKGTLDDTESITEGAVREVIEETGIIIDKNELETYLDIDDICSYFFLEYEKCEVEIQTQIKGNDANSVGWVNTKCLKTLVVDNKIKLTSHTKIILKTFLGFY